MFGKQGVAVVPVKVWRKCPACEGTGRNQAESQLTFEEKPDAQTIETLGMLKQGICLSCRGRGGFVSEESPRRSS